MWRIVFRIEVRVFFVGDKDLKWRFLGKVNVI